MDARSGRRRSVLAAILAASALVPLGAPGMAAQRESADLQSAQQRATATVKQMTPDEKTVLTHGIMAMSFGPDSSPLPKDAVPGAGYVASIPRLNIPSLRESDASLGVAYVGGIRKDGATALPSGVAMASTWSPDLLYRGGAMIGAEARAKGFNVLLAGGANLMRDPRNGRTFEYLSEDPLLTGDLVGAAIAGIQSNHIISTIKHFALNGQETGRKFVDVQISDAAARESDLLAFEIGIEKGHPGSVMCAYNKVNGANACDNDWLLNKVLKQSWGYPGFVMSDWGAVPGLGSALHGLDQQSGAQLDGKVYFGDELRQAAAKDPAYATRVDDMNKRVLTAIYAGGLDNNPATPGAAIDFAKDGDIAQEVAEKGIVLLRNVNDALPIAATAKRIAVIGGYASVGVLSGGGSSQVEGEDGPAASIPLGADGPFASFFAQNYQRSSPLKAIKALAPNAAITYRDGRYVADAVTQAKEADVAIVFATEWRTEGQDVPDLSLPDGQDALIAAVAAANPHTIVVLETGGPVAMPWLDKTAAVVEAWYPGARGGPAIANVLFGRTNPSGRLPITFPASTADLPRPTLDGYAELEPNFAGAPPTPDATLSANYNIEGSDVGYRWDAREGKKALFPFGYGLSYTSFTPGGLKIDGLRASFTIANTGSLAGEDIGQVYLVSRNGKASQRLVGFKRVSVAPGETAAASVEIDPRLLADWRDGGWSIPAGDYVFALGKNAETLVSKITVHMNARHWN
jgi:beta-glucosidase